MASITSLGSGSGLTNLEDMLDQLQKAEETRLTQITARQTSVKTRISAYSKLQSAVEAVQKAAATLGQSDTLNAVKSSVSGEGLTVKTAAGAVAGNYKIGITSLATAQTLKSNLVEDRKEPMGSGGSIQITLANDETTTIELGSDTSLDGVAKAINSNDDAGVRATIITDGDGNSYLMLTSKNTGTQSAVKSITSDNTAVQAVVGYEAGSTSSMTELEPAENAAVTINGVVVESQSNTIDKAIDGVTLELTATTEPDETISVSITSDPSVLTKAVKAFVDAYNSLQSTIADLTAFDVSSESQSALTGDGTTRNIQSTIAAALRVVGGEGTLRTLSQLGITSNPTSGKLELDETKLDKALADNPADVARLFGGAGGLAEKMKTATDGILGSNGSIKTRTEGLQETVESLQDQYDRTKVSIQATMDNYRAQFTRLDALVAQMNSLSSYLTQQFEAMSKQS